MKNIFIKVKNFRQKTIVPNEAQCEKKQGWSLLRASQHSDHPSSKSAEHSEEKHT
jgi:hypothetical protein